MRGYSKSILALVIMVWLIFCFSVGYAYNLCFVSDRGLCSGEKITLSTFFSFERDENYLKTHFLM